MTPAPQGATYRISAAAQMTGLSEQVLRAWERRYGLMSPQRTTGGYRVYTEEDIAVLRRLKELTERGMAIGEAARLVPQLRRELRNAQSGARPAPAAPRAEGGAARIDTWRGELLEAAAAMEPARMEATLDQALSALPPNEVFEQLVAPVAREIGERWMSGELSVAQEHLGTDLLRSRVRALLHASPRGAGPLVLAACFPEEQHELGLLGAVLKLRHAGVRVASLGMRTPVQELARAARRMQPALIALSAVTDRGRERFVRDLEEIRAAVPVNIPIVLGGRAANKHAEVARAHGFDVHADLSKVDAIIASLRR